MRVVFVQRDGTAVGKLVDLTTPPRSGELIRVGPRLPLRRAVEVTWTMASDGPVVEVELGPEIGDGPAQLRWLG